MARYLYNFLMLTALIAVFPMVLPFLVASPKRRQTVLPRLLFCFQRETLKQWRQEAGQLTIWVHALSLGEVASAMPLVRELEKIFGREKLVFSASTLTGFQTAVQNLDQYVRRIFFFPYDILFTVVRAVGLVDPDLVIIVETDLWPNFMDRMQAKGIPVMLVNARLSDRSTAGYRRIPGIMKPLLGTFETICVQSDEDARRFAALGARPDRLLVTGNMKFDGQVPSLEDRDVEKLRQTFHLAAGDRVIVAGSTHPGEEEILLAGIAALRKTRPELKLVVAPRNPERADAVKALFAAGGLRAACLAEIEGQVSGGLAEVVVIDRIGILGKTYALGDIAFVGGSLVRAGGHNPLEPAAHGKPVLFGPDMSDFRLIARWLVESGGAVTVNDVAGFTEQAERFLADSETARSAGRRAKRIFAAHSGAVDRTIAQVARMTGRPDG